MMKNIFYTVLLLWGVALFAEAKVEKKETNTTIELKVRLSIFDIVCLTRVVFPAPEGPRKPKTSPCRISKLKPFSTGFSVPG